MTEAWTLKGEMALSCSCTVFCPCVLSLGDHPPTEERCQTWAGIRIDDGHIDSEDLSGLKVGLMMDLPGIMSRGNWTAALFVDDKASAHGGERPHPHLHRPRRRHHASAVDPGRPIPRRAAGADQLRDARRDPHRAHREICRRRHHAGARQGGRARTSSSATANTGSGRTSSSRAPTSRASAASGATGIWPAVRPKSSSWIGATSA